MKRRLYFLVIVLLGLPSAAIAQTIPALNANAWNLIFVQSFEASKHTNNLSVKGFNHALLFGQLLNTITAGKSASLKQIYSFASKSSPQDMTSLQSIEPFAVLNNRSVSHLLVGRGGETEYGSPAYVIDKLLNNQARGDYIIAMPAAMINRTIKSLGYHASSASRLTPGDYNQYLVLSIENGKSVIHVYNDNLAPSIRYPNLHIKPTANYSCPEKPVRFTIKKPKSSKYRFNTRQTVYFVRHVEAHPNDTFENGNFVCKGEWRAIGANKILLKKMGGKVNNLFTTNPKDIIACGTACSYIRPALTISPLAIEAGQRLKLAKFQWSDAPTLAASLFTQNTPYSSKAFNHSVTLVAWEHANIEKAVRYLIGVIYADPRAEKKIPAWSYTDYDTIWELKSDDKGDITFSNSCEGIATAALPSTCPAFPVTLQR